MCHSLHRSIFIAAKSILEDDATQLLKSISVKIKPMQVKYFLFLILFVVAGCRKESAKLKSDLKGTWELVSMDGGWVGHHEYEPGNGNIYTFDGNKYSQVIKADDVDYEYSGTFVIYKGKPCDFASEQSLISFNESPSPSSFSLSGGKLVIGTTECIADGSTGTYRKIK